MMTKRSPTQSRSAITVHAIALQETPPVYIVALPGQWLLKHTTPSWRIQDPEKGFQRLVKDERAKQIARTVIEKGRTFPNAITLATNVKKLSFADGRVTLPASAKLLVVDGQHRLWAQTFASETEATYACILHLGKTEEEMAELFLEINENQRRVPSSLRWDLVRLVKPEGDQAAITASELVYELATRPESPFYISLDLTGEKNDLSIKQGSLAPEIKTLVARGNKQGDINFDDYLNLLIRYFTAIRSLDPNGWGDPKSAYYKARVFRALIRILTDIVLKTKTTAKLTVDELRTHLKKIDPATLSDERVRMAQGAAGVQDLYAEMHRQVFPAP